MCRFDLVFYINDKVYNIYHSVIMYSECERIHG